MRKIIIAVVILIIILIGVFIIFQLNSPKPLTITLEEVQQFNQDKANLENSIKSLDINNCQGLDSRDKAVCIKTIAINLSNSDLCSEIGKEDGKNWGQDDECFLRIAINKNDITLCNKIRQAAKKDGCLREIAINLNDINICKSFDQVSDGSKADAFLCYSGIAKTNKDITLCDNLNEIANKEYCIIEVAVALNDSSICNKISDSFIQETCKNKFV